MAIAGKNTLIQFRASSTEDWTTVDEINSGSLSTPANNIDITDFSTDTSFINRIQGLKDGTWSLSGFWDPADTDGQVAIRNAWLNDSTGSLQILPNGSAGFKQDIRVSEFTIESNVGEAVTVSISAEGNGDVGAST